MSPNESLPIWVEYPTIEYPNLLFVSTNASFPYLLNKLTFRLLVLTSNFAPLPGGVTLISILSCWYCRPPSRITTSTILPSDTTALSFAPKPVPTPTISRSGADVYSLPLVCTSTKDILPSVTIGFNCASLPVFTLIVIDFSRFKISEPYPVPSSYNNTSVISPLTTGVAVIIPTVVFDNSYFKFNLISGNLNTWNPVPWSANLT